MVNEFVQHGYITLILGGSSGLGLATARKLAAHGMGVCIVHRNTRSEMKEINASFDLIKATGVPFFSFNIDVTDEAARTETLSRLVEYRGRVRCLVHSIAKGSLKSMDCEADNRLSTEDFKLTLDYMAYSLYDWVIAVKDAGLFATDARVIAFTSEGSSRAWKHYAAVSAAKATLETMIRNMALSFAPFGIRANCIQAGVTETVSMQMIPGIEQLKEYTLQRNPYKRLTRPDDVANVVYLLCKDEAAWINGSIIPVDGGEHIC